MSVEEYEAEAPRRPVPLLPEKLVEELYRYEEAPPTAPPERREATPDEIARFKKLVKEEKMVPRTTFLPKKPPTLDFKRRFPRRGAYVCLERMARTTYFERYEEDGKTRLRPSLEKVIVKDPKTGKATEQFVRDEEFGNIQRCRDFPGKQVDQCLLTGIAAHRIVKKQDMPTCEVVKAAYACANDLSPTMASVVTDLPRDEVLRCLVDLKKTRQVEEPPSLKYLAPKEREEAKAANYFLDEPILRMPHPTAEATKKELGKLVAKAEKMV